MSYYIRVLTQSEGHVPVSVLRARRRDNKLRADIRLDNGSAITWEQREAFLEGKVPAGLVGQAG